MNNTLKSIFIIITSFLTSNAISNTSILQTENLIIDNTFAPNKIKSVNKITLTYFKGKIYSGCGKSIFNPLYQNNNYINKTNYKNLNRIFNNNTSILISVNNTEIYANTIVNDKSLCALQTDLENAMIQAYIVNVTSEHGKKANLIYLINYKSK